MSKSQYFPTAVTQANWDLLIQHYIESLFATFLVLSLPKRLCLVMLPLEFYLRINWQIPRLILARTAAIFETRVSTFSCRAWRESADSFGNTIYVCMYVYVYMQRRANHNLVLGALFMAMLSAHSGNGYKPKIYLCYFSGSNTPLNFWQQTRSWSWNSWTGNCLSTPLLLHQVCSAI